MEVTFLLCRFTGKATVRVTNQESFYPVANPVTVQLKFTFNNPGKLYIKSESTFIIIVNKFIKFQATCFLILKEFTLHGIAISTQCKN